MKMQTVINNTCFTPESKTLFRAVMRQLNASWGEVWEYPEDYRNALNGVGGFIYYNETEPFAKRNIENIMKCIIEFEDETGVPMHTENDLNWYAWFALEHIIDKIMCYKESL